jgi:ribosomal protein L37AE/L43A
MAEQKTIHTFACPQCGGPRVYQAATGGLACEHCGYQEAIEAPSAGSTAGESEFTEEALAQAEHGWQVGHQQIQCQSCGGETLLPPGVLTQTCPYCGSTYVVQLKATDALLRPHFMIPFRTTPERCRALTQEWLGSSWMTPRHLHKQADLGNYTPLYVPFWTFDAQVTANWSAEIGYDKTTIDAEGDLDTETRWEQESGQVRLEFDDQYVPGTKRLREILAERITDFNLRTLVAYNPAYLAGHHAQAYEVDLNQAWEKAQAQMKEKTRAASERDALSGKADHIRNLRLYNVELHDTKWRYVLLPVYVSTYKYRDKVHQMLVNGQKGTIGGQRPVSWPKVYLVALAPLLPFALAYLALSFGVGDLWKTLSSLPTLVGLGLSAGIIALLVLAVRWANETIQQARHIEAADADKKNSGSSLDGSLLKTWVVVLGPLVVCLLLLLVGALGFIGNSSFAAFRSLSRLAKALRLSSIPPTIALFIFFVGVYASPWCLRWARKKIAEIPT